MRELADRARGVLDANRIDSITRPGPHLYPHQWSWDSAFIAIGLGGERARSELRSLFAAQWGNGMLPQIVFHSETGEYFPGPDVWRTDLAANGPRDSRTSGIVQPPLHATAARRVGGREFLKDLFPRLAAWHDYLYRERDPHGTGLVAIRHPWESGMDDSPAWDAALAAIPVEAHELPPYRRVDLTMVAAHERPTRADYDHYVHLVEVAKGLRYDERLLYEHCPFLVLDPLFNALLVEAGRDLALIAEELGEHPDHFLAQADATAEAMNARLWSEEHARYLAYDLRADKVIPAPVLASFVPLFAGVPSPERAARMLAVLDAPGYWPRDGEGFPLPTVNRHSPAFAPHRYWRGPVWLNLNWLVYNGLRRYAFAEYAERMRDATLALVQDAGFREYFDPSSGEGLGSERFSWTAALVLDLLRGDTPP